jgi:hypothetical protein
MSLHKYGKTGLSGEAVEMLELGRRPELPQSTESHPRPIRRPPEFGAHR